MNINNLNELPDWKDDKDDDEGGESWKTNQTTEACKALYEKWNEVLIMLTGALGTMKEISEDNGEQYDETSFVADQKSMALGDAYEVGAKIRSSEAGSLYVLKMENASIIRKNAQFIKSAVLGLMVQGAIDEHHGEAIRDEIDVFRELFIDWVNTFQKDEFVDEWGLYV